MIGLDLLVPEQSVQRIYGVTIGIVTNNQDPEKVGRVKLKFPWLSDKEESNWARVLSPMAGNGRGFYCLPEIDDEVLVAFEHGDVNFPYVIGSLWNGKDKPPEVNDDGKNNRRLIKSRSGHRIILDDTEGEEKIIIQDKTQKNIITIDSKKNSLAIAIEGEITIESKGKMTIKTPEDLAINCNNLTIKTDSSCKVETGTDYAVKAKGKVKMEASSGAAIKSSAGVKINDTSLEVK